MPSFPNRDFTSPVPRRKRLATAAEWGMYGVFAAFLVAFGLVFVHLTGPSWLLLGADMFTCIGVFAIAGYLWSERAARKCWARLTKGGSVDPITIGEDRFEGDLPYPDDAATTRRHGTVPFEQVVDVLQWPEGFWLVSWKSSTAMGDQIRAYLRHHPEVAALPFEERSRWTKEHAEEVLGRRLETIPLDERGYQVMLTAENGERLRRAWEAWKKRTGATEEPKPIASVRVLLPGLVTALGALVAFSVGMTESLGGFNRGNQTEFWFGVALLVLAIVLFLVAIKVNRHVVSSRMAGR